VIEAHSGLVYRPIADGDTVSGIYSRAVTLDGNRATTNGAPGPSYSASSLTLGYNNRGRLSSVTTSSAATAYLYDALGQRIQKSTGNATTTVFIHDERGHLLGEYDGNGNLIEETVWVYDLPVATLQPNGTGGVNVFYIHADHLNTPKAITRPRLRKINPIQPARNT
jgi:YD repeat-containing protein